MHGKAVGDADIVLCRLLQREGNMIQERHIVFQGLGEVVFENFNFRWVTDDFLKK